MNKLGRRPLIIYGSIIMSIGACLFTICLYLTEELNNKLFDQISVPFMFIYAIGLFHSYGMMISVYLSEILPGKAYCVVNWV